MTKPIRRLKDVRTGHLDIQEHNIGIQTIDLVQESIGRWKSADDPDAALDGELGPQALDEHRVVVHAEHSDLRPCFGGARCIDPRRA